jgi:hypothetical protein
LNRGRQATPTKHWPQALLPERRDVRAAYSGLQALESARRFVALAGRGQKADRQQTRAAFVDGHPNKPANDASHGGF